MLLSDLWYFRGFQTLLSVHTLQQTTNLGSLYESVLSLTTLGDLVMVADLLVLLVVMAIFRKKIDLMPTLGYLLGVDKGVFAASAMGRNLLNTRKDFVVLADRTFVGEASEKEKAMAIQGIELSDKIIISDYFNGRQAPPRQRPNPPLQRDIPSQPVARRLDRYQVRGR